MEDSTYTLDELCSLTDLNKRTVRYYMQIGLVDRPEGETRAARYGPRHLDQCLKIRKWTQAGLSLERVRELFASGDQPVPARPRGPGTLEVWSHIVVADGVEVTLNPERANLRPEQVRTFLAEVMAAFEKLNRSEND
ncbi:helix-turn-helix domain-containing protein [Pseudoduganella sp. SL102]|uniref:helix-turn-helix domain-containing protein n=1 Tax=Pseudoduganella sp. SL102 TaxID=2995154 RepID=UPI00248CCCDF|nr:helix-turn-helix domain-containing protein [Pseudoduganella sp. SL102]WBS02391.1 helix-turn-helix domain-containing protein [Pseudoduganella sp. SL102]